MSVDHLLNQITEPLVCSHCYDEMVAGQTDSASLQTYTQLDVGFTERGVQIWCRRHDLNVCHIDFEGQALEADFRCLLPRKDA